MKSRDLLVLQKRAQHTRNRAQSSGTAPFGEYESPALSRAGSWRTCGTTWTASRIASASSGSPSPPGPTNSPHSVRCVPSRCELLSTLTAYLRAPRGHCMLETLRQHAATRVKACAPLGASGVSKQPPCRSSSNTPLPPRAALPPSVATFQSFLPP